MGDDGDDGGVRVDDGGAGDGESLEEVRALDKLLGTSRVRARVNFVRFCALFCENVDADGKTCAGLRNIFVVGIIGRER